MPCSIFRVEDIMKNQKKVAKEEKELVLKVKKIKTGMKAGAALREEPTWC